MAGPRIQALRIQQGLTQQLLAARCQLLGWDLSRETLAKIESQVRWISDFELLCLAVALKVEIGALLPTRRDISAVLRDFFGRLSPLPPE